MAIHTFNAFLAEQVDDAGDVNVTLAQFDNEYEVVYLREPVRQAPRRTADTYVPRGTKPFHGPMLALTRILRHASRAIIAP